MKEYEKIIEFINREEVVSGEQLLEQFHSMDTEKNIQKALKALLEAGEIVKDRRGRICSLEYLGYDKGILEVKRGGFAFVRADGDDIFISSSDQKGALNGEMVLVRLTTDAVFGKHREGKVERVLSKTFITTGTYKKEKNAAFVICDDRTVADIYIPKNASLKAQSGQKVVVELTKRAAAGKGPEGRVIEILGKKGDPGVDILSVARGFGLVQEFPEKVCQELEHLSLRIDESELMRREILFDKTIFTIDGDDAKDLDDAVSLERLNNGNWLLGVHIADVSHYVREGSALDREALKRGTSVYLVDRVIPMLPQELSNGICSLNPQEVRLTLSCFMEFTPKGVQVSRRLAKTAIRSKHRMTYKDVNRILEERDAKLLIKYQDIIEPLQDMAALAAILRRARFKSGSIDFDIPEAKIQLDSQGKPQQIALRERGTAEKLIEEFMLVCNNTVGEESLYLELPFLYRIHETPDPDKMRELAIFLKNFGYRIKGLSNLHSKALQEILISCEGTEQENIINRVMLRSLKKAKYATDNVGHFGLASRAYSHFTSPIRRYPDLMVHRILKENMQTPLSKNRIAKLEEILPAVASRSSERERHAIEAERRVEDLKKAEYISNYVGESFDGVVSGVTPTALFVELPNTIEGVIPLSAMKDDYYVYFKELYCVIGERTKRRYNLGDQVRIIVKDVNIDEARVEFAFERQKPRKIQVRASLEKEKKLSTPKKRKGGQSAQQKKKERIEEPAHRRKKQPEKPRRNRANSREKGKRKNRKNGAERA